MEPEPGQNTGQSRSGTGTRRIIVPNGSGRHTADVRIAHVGEQKKVSRPEACAAPVGKFAITMRHQGKEQTTAIPLPSPALEMLALEAKSRDLDIAGLIGQVLVASINKDMIQKILGPSRRPHALEGDRLKKGGA